MALAFVVRPRPLVLPSMDWDKGLYLTSYDLEDSHAPLELWGGRVAGVKPCGANLYRRRVDRRRSTAIARLCLARSGP
jgi:hypothetical protein